MASNDDVSALVTCEWLQGKLTAGELGDIVILDVSWSSETDCLQAFQNRHIPGARYLNVMAGPHTELFPRNLPSQEKFQEAVRAVGVNDDSHVILYSESDNNGFFLSGRAWWTFTVYGAKSVSILNGGLQKWLALGFPTTSDATAVKSGNFTACYESHHRRSFEDMSKLAGTGAAVLDSRAQDRYSEGHLPGAKSLPYTQLMDTTKQEMMSPDDVREVLRKCGVDTAQPLTTYCNSGMSSCTLAFAYKLCGGTDFAVYHGGFTEWKTKAKDNIEKS